MVFIPPTQEQFRDELRGGQVISLQGDIVRPPQQTFDVSQDIARPPSFDVSQDIARPPTTQPTALPTALPTAPPITQPTAPTQPPAAQAQPAPAPFTTGPLFGQTGTTRQRLFEPLGQSIGQATGRIQSLGQQFAGAVGPTGQTFETRGGEAALGQFVQGGFQDPAARQAAETRAREFTGAKFRGPTGLQQLAPERLQALRGGAERLRTRARGLRTGGGLQTILGQGVPGLGAGAARFEARQLLQDPTYRQEAARQAQEAGGVVSRLAGEERRARGLARTRGGEEAEIQRRARGLLTGQRGGIESQIQEEIESREATSRTTREAYEKFQQTGDPRDLLQAQTSFDPTGFLSPGRRGAEEAVQRFQAIQEKYPQIAQFELRKGITKRGRPGDVLETAQGPMFIHEARGRGLITAQQASQLRERQKELKGTFGREGELGDIAPLTLGGPREEAVFEAADPRSFTQFDPGIRPSRGNVSTKAQRGQFNRINELLDEVDQISDAGEPFRAAMVAGEVDRYLAEEQQTLEARGEELDKRQKDWLQQVYKARKRYRRKRRDKEWGKLVGGLEIALASPGLISGITGVKAFGGKRMPKARVGEELPGLNVPPPGLPPDFGQTMNRIPPQAIPAFA